MGPDILPGSGRFNTSKYKFLVDSVLDLPAGARAPLLERCAMSELCTLVRARQDAYVLLQAMVHGIRVCGMCAVSGSV